MTASTETTISARTEPLQRVPEFFIVGHHKCGTTALYEMLRRHPQVFMPNVKAPRFFASDVHPESQLPGTLDAYLALFEEASPEQRLGEASESYLWSSHAARAIAEVQPRARIIAILREPASFLRSLHLQYVQAGMETELQLRKALSLEPARRREHAGDAEWTRALWYSDHVRYVEQLARYHAVFPSEQVLALIYDDFLEDNEATVRRVLRFVDVDDERPIEMLRANPTVRLRSPKLNELVRSLYLGRGPLAGGMKAAAKTLSSRRMRHQALRLTRRRVIYGQPRPADESLMMELRHTYKEEVTALSEYLGRDLASLWGYDHLD
jgi:hypothetical protein